VPAGGEDALKQAEKAAAEALRVREPCTDDQQRGDANVKSGAVSKTANR
jgi:hypothetical protein